MLILEIALGVLLGGLLRKYFKYFLALGFLAVLLLVVILAIALAVFFVSDVSPSVLIGVLCTLVLTYFFLEFKVSNKDLKEVIRSQINKKESLGYDISDLESQLKTIEKSDEIQNAIKVSKLKEDVAIKNAIKEKTKTKVKVSKAVLNEEMRRRKSLGYED